MRLSNQIEGPPRNVACERWDVFLWVNELRLLRLYERRQGDGSKGEGRERERIEMGWRYLISSMTSRLALLLVAPHANISHITPSIQLNSTLSPYSLYLLPSPRIHVVCQTQHLRYFLRGLHFSSFSSFPSSLSLPDPQVTTRYVDLQPVGMGASNVSSISSPIALY